jgi:hypothetical protein
MSKQTRFVANSIVAISAGFAALFAIAGIAFGAIYVIFFDGYLLDSCCNNG